MWWHWWEKREQRDRILNLSEQVKAMEDGQEKLFSVIRDLVKEIKDDVSIEPFPNIIIETDAYREAVRILDMKDEADKEYREAETKRMKRVLQLEKEEADRKTKAEKEKAAKDICG